MNPRSRIQSIAVDDDGSAVNVSDAQKESAQDACHAGKDGRMEVSLLGDPIDAPASDPFG